MRKSIAITSTVMATLLGGTAAVQFALLGTSSHPTITNADFLVS